MLDIIKNIPFVNVNMDSDGILSYLFFKKGGAKCKIGGYNNSSDVILSKHDKEEEIWEDMFIDIFTPRKGVYTIDQHIINNSNSSIFDKEKINPNILIEKHIACDNTYYTKYPFSTCLFVLGLLERNEIINTEINLFQDLQTFNLIDLILRADGVLYNFVKYKSNVKHWSDKMVEFSKNGTNTSAIINYLLSLTDEQALNKHNIINDFYIKYGLTCDGGYNKKKTLEKNLSLLNKLLKAFANHLNIETFNENITLYVYKGENGIVENNTDICNLKDFDTYAFVGKKKLSYSKNFKKTKDILGINIYDGL